MSVSNLFKPGGLRWQPDSNDVNAPDGALLRADNMVPDEDGALVVRRGSEELYNFPDGTEDIHSLHTVELVDGYTYRMMAADSQMNKNPGPGNHTAHWERLFMDAADFETLTQLNYTGGSWEKDYAQTGDVGPVVYTSTWESDYTSELWTALEPVNFNVTFAGTGDIAIGDDHQQTFMARSTSTKKFDGKSFMEWGIAKPANAPAVSAVAPDSESILAFSAADPVGTTVGGTGSSAVNVPGHDGVADAATQFTPGPDADGYTYINIYKTWGTDQNFLNVDGTDGTDRDVLDILVKMDDPSRVKSISFKIDVGSGPATADIRATGYRFVFLPKSGVAVTVKDPKLDGANAYEAKVDSSLDPVNPKDKPRVNTPEEVKATVASVGDEGTTKTEGSAPGAGDWVHFSVTRGQFRKVGYKAGRGWDTVRALRMVIHNDDGYTGTTTLQNFIVYSGGAGTLIGSYQAVYRWVRETDYYYELSPPSDASSPISLFGNQLKITIPGADQNSADDQVTDCWVYIFGGYLDTYYRAAVATADPQLSTDLAVTIETGEIQILTENEVLEPYTDEPRDNIIAIAGPWNGRLFTCTSEGYVYPSLQTCPNLFNTYQVIDLSKLGDPLWMVKTSSGIHCGMEKDVVFLAGTGDESADRVVIDLYPHPLNIGNPPFERGCVFVDGNAIIYRATDGLMMLSSQNIQPIPDGGTRLLWRDQARHGVSALNVLTGRFRVAADNKILYVLAPEGATSTGGTTIIYRLDLNRQQWSRLIYPNALLSIFNEPDGTLIAGGNDGVLLKLESGTGDESEDPTVTILTPFLDGGAPLVRKDAFDLQLHTDTNSNTMTVSAYKDGSSTATSTYPVVTTQPQVYRAQAEDFGAFIKAQLKMTGTFDELYLSGLNLTYRTRPQHMTYLDTGYILPSDPHDVAWLQEVELDANSPSNITCELYLDDTLYTTQTVTVTANVRTMYRIPLPRGSKGRRPRLVFKTTASDGAGEIGFDPYMVRVRARNSGNKSGVGFTQVWPAGQAP